MVDVSRRWFLIGSAASVALIAAKPSLLPEVLPEAASQSVVEVPLHGMERLHDLTFVPDGAALVKQYGDMPVTFRLFRAGGDSDLLRISLNPRSLFKWGAGMNPANMIVVPKGTPPLVLSVTPEIGRAGFASFNYRDDCGEMWNETWQPDATGQWHSISKYAMDAPVLATG